MGEVVPDVGGTAPGGMTISREVAVPDRRVVETGLPGMHHDRQTDAGRVARASQVGVLGNEPRIHPAQELPGRLDVARVSMHLERGAGVDGGLGDAGCLDVPGRVLAAVDDCQKAGPGK